MNGKKSYVWLKISAVLLFVVAIFASGFLFLDKIIIPKYFGEYGINGLRDLSNMISSLYDTPNEDELITNGYSQDDLESGVKKLQNAHYKIEDDGTILEKNIETFQGDGRVCLSDREFAAICNKLLQTNLFRETLEDLNYIDLINISILDFVVSPDESSLDETTGTYSKANIKLIVKINTANLRTQIAEQMQTSEALLKIIIPNNLYFTATYDIDLAQGDYLYASGSILINGRTEKQSDILINLLIDFIFPPEDEMNKELFTMEIGNIALETIDSFGEFGFSNNIDEKGLNGFILY